MAVRRTLDAMTCRALGVFAALALVLGGCSFTTHPSVLDVAGDPASTELIMSVESCNQDPKVTAEETLTEVRLRVTADADNDDDCLDSASVSLEAPLGDRAVIDDASGNRLPVRPAAG